MVIPDVRVVPAAHQSTPCHEVELHALSPCRQVLGLVAGLVVAELRVRAHGDECEVSEVVERLPVLDVLGGGGVLDVLGAGGEVLDRGAVAEGEVPPVLPLDEQVVEIREDDPRDPET